jgi:CAAX prenyl protease-like protein
LPCASSIPDAAALTRKPAFARVFPFAAFIAFLAAQPLLEGVLDARWLAVARGVVVAAILAWFWRDYVELRARPAVPAWHWLAAVAAGAAVFALWIRFDSGWAVMGGEGGGFVPLAADGSLDWPLALLRLAGLALVVPVMEELFWRSFLLRWIDRRDFLGADPRRASLVAFAVSSALFAVEHSLWFAGLLAGIAYTVLYMLSRNLWIPIASHATTNALLGTWILATGNWRFW